MKFDRITFHPHISFARKFALGTALVILEGCANPSAYNTGHAWDIKHVVKRNSSASAVCSLEITTMNNTKMTFLGVNTRFLLLDKSKKMVGEIKYFVDGTILPGYGLPVKREVAARCNDIDSIQILYLSLPVPTGYYKPSDLETEIQ
jgi:hypothetical protein